MRRLARLNKLQYLMGAAVAGAIIDDRPLAAGRYAARLTRGLAGCQ